MSEELEKYEDETPEAPDFFEGRQQLPPKLQVGLSPDGSAAISITAIEDDGTISTRSVILNVSEAGDTALQLLAIYNMHVANGYAAALRSHAEQASRLAVPKQAPLWTPGSEQ